MLYVFENTLSEQLIADILRWNDETKAGDVWASNQTKWVDSLKYATAGVIFNRVMPGDLSNRIYDEIQSRGFIDYSPWSRSTLFYIGMPNSCVNWHADYAEYNALSIYLNKEWDTNWGGWFAYTEEFNWQEGDVRPPKGQFIVPRYNLSVMSTEKEWHCTTPISPFAQPRLSIQLFFSKKHLNGPQ